LLVLVCPTSRGLCPESHNLFRPRTNNCVSQNIIYLSSHATSKHFNPVLHECSGVSETFNVNFCPKNRIKDEGGGEIYNVKFFYKCVSVDTIFLSSL